MTFEYWDQQKYLPHFKQSPVQIDLGKWQWWHSITRSINEFINQKKKKKFQPKWILEE